MSRVTVITALAATGICGTAALAGGEWVNYENEVSTRYVGSSGLFTTDPQEKDYAWGDVDNDGDIDLVIVRKQPFTSTGKFANVLLLNEGTAEGHGVNGVLVDYTDEFASDSDVGGDNGFLTPTNDRDVQLADLDNDGWLDIVTATTLTDNQAKHMSHPRVYMNLGEDGNGNWQGFRYEDARIPQMHPTAGPRFCSVTAGDVTGDGYADLYFGDYDSGGGQIMDYNNRLLINDGSGFFSDESTTRMTSTMLLAAFGAASEIADMNNDGVNDVIKQTSLNAPTHVAITYNNPANEGFFNLYDTLYDAAPYFVNTADFNNDGKLDLIIVDDNTDRYLINTGNDAQNQANFSQSNYLGSGGFGGNALARDLNNDGFVDTIITDVDVDISGCQRDTLFYRNNGVNGSNFLGFTEDSPIPSNMELGWHDAAIFDLNGDGWLDIVAGRCSGTQIWMNQPPVGLVFTYPQGLPNFVTPDETTEIIVNVEAFGGGTPAPGTGMVFISVNGAPFQGSAMTDLPNDQYSAILPALACTETMAFYFTAELQGGGTFQDPPGAPGNAYEAIAAEGTEITVQDNLEGDTSAWTTFADGSVTTGDWEAVDPEGALFNGDLSAPDNDANNGAENVIAFVTENGAPGGGAGDADLDGGPVRLMSPVFDLEGTDGVVSFARWFFTSGGTTDFMTVDISNDGGSSWVNVPEMTTSGTNSSWEDVSFTAGEYVAPTANMMVRWTASDFPNDSVTEAGVDSFAVETFDCGDVEPTCPTDITGDGNTDVLDLIEVILAWGGGAGAADVNDDGVVNVLDLVDVVLGWGPCKG